MGEYSDPVKAMRQQVKEMLARAEQLRRQAQEKNVVADTIRDNAIELDLLADKVERASQAPRP